MNNKKLKPILTLFYQDVRLFLFTTNHINKRSIDRFCGVRLDLWSYTLDQEAIHHVYMHAC